jgi:hypothetical protein
MSLATDLITAQTRRASLQAHGALASTLADADTFIANLQAQINGPPTCKFIVTPAMQAKWQAAWTAGHPLAKACDKNISTNNDGTGKYQCFRYAMLGNLADGQAAAPKLMANIAKPYLPSGGGSDTLRNTIVESCMMYDWLARAWPTSALDPTQDAAYLASIKGQADALALEPLYDPDINESQGRYWMRLVADVLLGTTHLNDVHGSYVIGGLTPTGTVDKNGAPATLRNYLWQWCQYYVGGGHPEGEGYGPTTVSQLLTMWAAAKTAYGTDYFPEIAAFVPAFAEAMWLIFSPDFNRRAQWGDDSHGRGALWFRYGWLCHMVHGCMQQLGLNDPGLNAVCAFFMSKGTDTFYHDAFYRCLWFFDPSLPIPAPAPPVKTHFCSGVGELLYKDSQEMFYCVMQSPQWATHSIWSDVVWGLDFGGEAAFTFPIGYGILTDQCDANNAVLLGGQSVCANRGVIAWGPKNAARTGFASDTWQYMTSKTFGIPWDRAHNPPSPAEAIHLKMPTIIHLAGGIVIERYAISCNDPSKLAGFSYYINNGVWNNQDLANGALALIQHLSHWPTMPAVAGGVVTCTSPKGQQLTKQYLAPSSPNVQAYADNVIMLAPPYKGYANCVTPAELKYQTRLLSPGNLQPDGTYYETIVVVSSVGPAPVCALNADGSVTVAGNTFSFNDSTGVVIRT